MCINLSLFLLSCNSKKLILDMLCVTVSSTKRTPVTAFQESEENTQSLFTSRQMRSSNVKRGPRCVAPDDRHLYVCGHDVMQVTGMPLQETGCNVISKCLVLATGA